MEAIQEEYGSIDKWGSLTDGTAYAEKEYIRQHGSLDGWDDLKPKEKAKYEGEPDAKAVIFGFTQMLNEGIDMSNEENGTNIGIGVNSKFYELDTNDVYFFDGSAWVQVGSVEA